MPYKRESDMYPDVCEWLQRFLRDRFKKAEVSVHEVSRVSLAEFIRRSSFQAMFPPEWTTWDIHVDVVGFIEQKRRAELAFVECKLMPITLMHFSQLLGYSRVAKPSFSFLISPRGISGSMLSLLETYHRTDVLEYVWLQGSMARTICIAKWDASAKTIDLGSCIGGSSFGL
jgi:hypothetical protein